jgi:anthranilate synthase component 1
VKKFTFATDQTVDPFYLYLHLQSIVAPNHAFLLEAGRADDSALYQMSLVGLCPVVEVQIKDGLVAVFANSALENLFETMQNRIQQDAQAALVWPSAVSDEPFLFRPEDPMAFLESIRQILKETCAREMEQPFSAGFLGYAGFDAVHYLERLPKTTEDDRALPDVRLAWHAAIVQLVPGEITLYRQDDASVFGQESDGLGKQISEVVTQLCEIARFGLGEPQLLNQCKIESSEPPEVAYDIPSDMYQHNVEKAKAYIRQGDIFQVVLSTRMRIKGAIHPYQAYDALRKLNPSPYMFVAEYPGMRLYGASPEVQFRCIQGRAEMKPIAGTSRGRGQSEAENRRLVEALRADEKECAEHVMLVDLCRNDLGRVAVTGSVHVPDLMVVEGYSHLYHLVSRVEAVLQSDISVFHALLATFPNGTLSGAPKIRAMEIIDELEPVRRGPYGGFIGMVDADANANTAIIIRTVIEVDGTQYVQVGAGIVLDSDPEREWQECHHKAGAILDVLTTPVV